MRRSGTCGKRGSVNFRERMRERETYWSQAGTRPVWSPRHSHQACGCSTDACQVRFQTGINPNSFQTDQRIWQLR